MKRKGFITEKQLKYFRFDFQIFCNLGKIYFLPKIDKQLWKIPVKPVISKCGTPKEEVSEFLGKQLQPILRKGFINKMRRMSSILDNAILVTADVTAL